MWLSLLAHLHRAQWVDVAVIGDAIDHETDAVIDLVVVVIDSAVVLDGIEMDETEMDGSDGMIERLAVDDVIGSNLYHL